MARKHCFVNYTLTVIYDDRNIIYYDNCIIKHTTLGHFALDIGKHISLVLMAKKYNFDARIDGGVE